MKHLVIGATFLFAGVVSLSALAAPRLPERIHHLVHRRLTSNEGLPSNGVTGMTQDRNGYLWFSTHEGLARFDGARFTTYDRRNQAAIEASFMSGVQAVGDAVYFAIKGQGVGVLRDGQVEVLGPASGLTNANLNALAADERGTVWLATDGGLFALRHSRFDRFGPTDGLPSNHLTALAVEAGGRLWIGTANEGVVVREGNTFSRFTVETGLPSNSIRTLHVGRSGSIYVGTDRGLARFEDRRFVPVTSDPRLVVPIRALREDRDGRLWVGTDGAGLALLEGETIDWYGSRDGLGLDRVEAIFQDREGGVWVATEGGGVDVFRRGRFTTYGAVDGLASEIVLSMLHSQDGALWVGTMAGGLSRLDENGVTQYGPQDGLGDSSVLSLLESSDGKIYAGTMENGVYVFDGEPPWQPLDELLAKARVSTMLEDQSKVLWIGADAGLFRYESGQRRVYDVSDGLPGDNVKCLAQAPDGSLWIGTRSGLAILRDGLVSKSDRGRSLPKEPILAIHQDGPNRVWLGTMDGGILILDKDGTHALTVRDGLLDDSAFGLVGDEDGRLWVTCSLGIYSFTKRSVEDLLAKERGALTPRVFGVADGLKSKECVGGGQNTAMTAPDGRLWFATIKGAAVVNPRRLAKAAESPSCRLEEVLIDGRPLPGANDRVLPASTKTLEVRFSAASLMDPGQLRFEHKLIGFDSDWVDAGSHRFAHYTNLDPGTYELRVRAFAPDTAKGGPELMLRLRQEPRLHETWWFRAAMVCASLLPIMLFVRLRTRRITRRNRELEKAVTERTAELRQRNQQLEELSLRDPLTELRNRRFLVEVVAPQCAIAAARSQISTLGLDRRAGANAAVYGVFLLDLDDFKRINDELGHDAGDAALSAVARALSQSVRADDVVVRWGGEEFLIVLKDTQADHLETFANEVLALVSSRPLTEVRGIPLRLSCSLGFLAFPPSARFPKSLTLTQTITLADRALYLAKAGGKDRAVRVVVDDAALTSEQAFTDAFLTIASRAEGIGGPLRFEPLPRLAR